MAGFLLATGAPGCDHAPDQPLQPTQEQVEATPEIDPQIQSLSSQLDLIETVLKNNAQNPKLTEEKLNDIFRNLINIESQTDDETIIERVKKYKSAVTLTSLALQAPVVSERVNTIIASVQDYELTAEELEIADSAFTDATKLSETYSQNNEVAGDPSLYPPLSLSLTGISPETVVPDQEAIRAIKPATAISLARGRSTGKYFLSTLMTDDLSSAAWECPEPLTCQEVTDWSSGSTPVTMADGILESLYTDGFGSWESGEGALPFMRFIQTFSTENEEIETSTYTEILKDPQAIHDYYLALEKGLLGSHPFGIIFPEESDGKYSSVTVKELRSKSLIDDASEAMLTTRQEFLRLLFNEQLTELVQAYESMILKKGWEKYRPILSHHENLEAYDGVTPGFVRIWNQDAGEYQIIPDQSGGNLDEWNLHLAYEKETTKTEKLWVRRAWAAETANGVAPEILAVYMLRSARQLGLESSALKAIAGNLGHNSKLSDNPELSGWYRQEIGHTR